MHQPSDKHILAVADAVVAEDGTVTLPVALAPGRKVHVVVQEMETPRQDLPLLKPGEKLPIEEVQQRLAGTLIGNINWEPPACDLNDWEALRGSDAE